MTTGTPPDATDSAPDFAPPRSWGFKFACAFRGWSLLLRGETSAWVHSLGAILAIAVAAWLAVDLTRWAMIATAIGLVFSAELLNTAVETLARRVERKENPEIRDALDLAAGGVLAASATAVVLGLIALGPPLVARFAGA